MPKIIPERELEAIAAIIADNPDGVQVGAIRDGLELDLPPRMLQRRLSLLAKQGRIVVSGTGKGTRYRMPGVTLQIDSAHHNHRSSEVKLEVYIPVSPEGKAIKEAIRLPVQDRQPVGYRREFLNAYRSNETFYLPEETRRRLLEMGRTPDGERPR